MTQCGMQRGASLVDYLLWRVLHHWNCKGQHKIPVIDQIEYVYACTWDNRLQGSLQSPSARGNRVCGCVDA